MHKSKLILDPQQGSLVVFDTVVDLLNFVLSFDLKPHLKWPSSEQQSLNFDIGCHSRKTTLKWSNIINSNCYLYFRTDQFDTSNALKSLKSHLQQT